MTGIADTADTWSDRSPEQRNRLTDLGFAVLLGLFVAGGGALTAVRSPLVDWTPLILFWPFLWAAVAYVVCRMLTDGPVDEPGRFSLLRDRSVRSTPAPLVRTWLVLMAWGWLLQLRVVPRTTTSVTAMLTLVVVAVVVLVGAWIGLRISANPDNAGWKVALPALIAALVLLGVNQFGDPVGGQRIGVTLPVVGTIQPGEFARVLLIVAFAAALYAPRWRTLGPAGDDDQDESFWNRVTHLLNSDRRVSRLRLPIRSVVTAGLILSLAIALLFLQGDSSPILLLGITAVVIVAVVLTVPRGRMIAFLLGAIAVFGVLGYIGHVGDVWNERVDQWLQPYPAAGSTQLGSSLLANSRGVPFGTGMGEGSPTAVPAASTDFVLSVLAEEWGTVGVAAVIGLYLFLLMWCWKQVRWARAGFPQILCASLTILLSCQLIYVLAGVSRVFPHGGLTVPFLSLGGSSLVALALLIGLIVGLGRTGDNNDQHTKIARRSFAAHRGFAITIVIIAMLGMVVFPLREGTPARLDAAEQASAETRPYRPTIVTADGEVIAETIGVDGECSGWTDEGFDPPLAARRCYPHGGLYADATGQVDTRNGGGAVALEDVIGAIDVCNDPSPEARLFFGDACTSPRTVETSLKHATQEQAAGLLAPEVLAKGTNQTFSDGEDAIASIVVSDPQDGDIEALVSKPTYDPNARTGWPGKAKDGSTLTLTEAMAVTGRDPANFLAGAVQTSGDWYADPPRVPLSDGEDPFGTERVITEPVSRNYLFPVASVMKLVTATAGIRATPNLIVRDWPETDAYGRRMNPGSRPCGGTLTELIAASCNSSFSYLADEIGRADLEKTAADLGFADVLPQEIELDADQVDEADESETPAQLDQPDGRGPWLDGLTVARAELPPFDPDGKIRIDGKLVPKRVAEEGIGLDDTVVNPLTVTALANAIGNGGVAVPLRLLTDCADRRDADLPANRCGSEGVELPVERLCDDATCKRANRPMLSEAEVEVLWDGMRHAVTGWDDRPEVRETAPALRDLKLRKVPPNEVVVAAKTGSAKVDTNEPGRQRAVGWCVAIVRWTPPGSETQTMRTFTAVVRGVPDSTFTGSDVCAHIKPLIEGVIDRS